jgi:ubiquinone/menaquinone biosynthesis C-methylase UbiE
MKDQSDFNFRSEETRIKSVYALRQRVSLYSWFNPGYLFYIQQLEKRILSLLQTEALHGLSDIKLLEIGCGHGNWLREFIKWGASPNNLTGIDLLPDRVEKAKQLCPPGVELRCGNASKLPFHDDTFDLVVQFTVFSSILDTGMRKEVAREMIRVLKDGGRILWYDFYINNPRNPDVRGIGSHEIAELFPECRIDFHKVSLAPPLSRLLASYSWLACYALERLRLFNTHYLGVIKKVRR